MIPQDFKRNVHINQIAGNISWDVLPESLPKFKRNAKRKIKKIRVKLKMIA